MSIAVQLCVCVWMRSEVDAGYLSQSVSTLLLFLTFKLHWLNDWLRLWLYTCMTHVHMYRWEDNMQEDSLLAPCWSWQMPLPTEPSLLALLNWWNKGFSLHWIWMILLELLCPGILLSQLPRAEVPASYRHTWLLPVSPQYQTHGHILAEQALNQLSHFLALMSPSYWSCVCVFSLLKPRSPEKHTPRSSAWSDGVAKATNRR